MPFWVVRWRQSKLTARRQVLRGAATGELATKAIAGVLYPDVTDLSKLNEEQKQTISTLATISAGMAGGLAGDSAGSAVAGGQAGKNAAENNSLSKDKIFDINPMLKMGAGLAIALQTCLLKVLGEMVHSVRPSENQVFR